MIPKSKPPENLMAAIPNRYPRIPSSVESFLNFVAELIAEKVLQDLKEGRVTPEELAEPAAHTPAKEKAAGEPPRMLSFDEVEDLTGLEKREISRLERDGWFPRRRRGSSGRVTWPKNEVDDWVVLWQRRYPFPVRIRVRVSEKTKKGRGPLRDAEAADVEAARSSTSRRRSRTGRDR